MTIFELRRQSQEFATLISQFIDGAMTAHEFETGVIALRRNWRSIEEQAQSPNDRQTEIEAFLRAKRGEITADEFRNIAKGTIKLTPEDRAVGEIIDSLFSDADAFCDDPRLFRADQNITEAQLRGSAAAALKKLEGLLAGMLAKDKSIES